ncbi:hypothetical protein FJNA_14680 [Thermus sp. FJN-A]
MWKRAWPEEPKGTKARGKCLPKGFFSLGSVPKGGPGPVDNPVEKAPGYPAAPDPWRLGLLPSGPDPVHARTAALDRGLG